MPHICLDTTSNLLENPDINDILADLVGNLAEFETVASEAIKAYHTLRTHWVMGEGAPRGFVHCTVKLISGRPVELRQQIADKMMDTLVRAFRQSIAEGEAGITVDVAEMSAATYRKSVNAKTT